MDFFQDFPISYLDYLRVSNSKVTYLIDYEHKGIELYNVVRVIPNNVINTIKNYECFRRITAIEIIHCQCKKCDKVLYMLEK